MMEKTWEKIVEASFASGCAHCHTEDKDWGFLEVIDDSGNHAIWKYDKKNQEIRLDNETMM